MDKENGSVLTRMEIALGKEVGSSSAPRRVERLAKRNAVL